MTIPLAVGRVESGQTAGISYDWCTEQSRTLRVLGHWFCPCVMYDPSRVSTWLPHDLFKERQSPSVSAVLLLHLYFLFYILPAF